MKKIYFLSDAHLGIESQEHESHKEKQLLSFFRHLENHADTLYILGDLFDFWFDYRWVIPRHYLNIISALKRLTEHGVKVIYCIGNHDFWLGNFFNDDLNIEVHREPIQMEMDGHRFYIGHGDGINKKDIGYLFLKAILRSPITALACRLMHPDLTFSLARWFSSISRKHRADLDHREPYINFAKELFQEGCQFVVFGHTHDPMTLHLNGCTYINTGDWINHFTYAVYSKDSLKLEKWT